jgi:hypothetical protein
MFEQAFRNIDDVLRKEAGCTTELDYTEQTSWLLPVKKDCYRRRPCGSRTSTKDPTASLTWFKNEPPFPHAQNRRNPC